MTAVRAPRAPLPCALRVARPPLFLPPPAERHAGPEDSDRRCLRRRAVGGGGGAGCGAGPSAAAADRRRGAAAFDHAGGPRAHRATAGTVRGRGRWAAGNLPGGGAGAAEGAAPGLHGAPSGWRCRPRPGHGCPALRCGELAGLAASAVAEAPGSLTRPSAPAPMQRRYWGCTRPQRSRSAAPAPPSGPDRGGRATAGAVRGLRAAGGARRGGLATRARRLVVARGGRWARAVGGQGTPVGGGRCPCPPPPVDTPSDDVWHVFVAYAPPLCLAIGRGGGGDVARACAAETLLVPALILGDLNEEARGHETLAGLAAAGWGFAPRNPRRAPPRRCAALIGRCPTRRRAGVG